ncbi:MAG: acetyl-coenzyme A synthetase, partial [Actinobacteria bacterium]|nr:acetyl-coenzyme A synthetase [Actinomycetota bacterium]
MSDAIETHQTEIRHFAPSPEFAASAIVADSSLHDAGDADFESFWAGQARDLLHWDTEWSRVLDWDPPNAKWFVDGKLNVTYNCLDR